MNYPVRIRKAVFPVAGLGTRFLPATKSVPKEMLPVVDKPLIQYAVEEAIEAGVETMIIVTRGDKRAITEHFRASSKLERYLEERGQSDVLDAVQRIMPAGVEMREAIQPEPLGLGHAVLCARELVGDEPFAVILPDDMVKTGGPGCLGSMVRRFAETGNSQVGVEAISPELTGMYGIAGVRDMAGGDLSITELVEKPAPEEAPSNLGVVGRYVLTAGIFAELETIGAGAGGEIQLTDAIARLMQNETVEAFPLSGQRFDCGSRQGFLMAQLAYALDDPELEGPLTGFMAELLGQGSREER